MREFREHLRSRAGLAGPSLVAGAVLTLTSLAFFRVALLPEFGAELAMSTVELGAVATVFGLGRLAADLPGGHLADRVGAVRLMVATGVGIAGGSLLLGTATVPWVVLAAALLLGLSSSVTNATGMTFFSTVAGTGFRGTSMALFSAGMLGGQALGPAVAGLLAGAWGWRTALLIGAGLALAVSIALMLGPTTGVTSPPGPAKAMVGKEKAARPSRKVVFILQSVPFAVFLTLGSVFHTLVPVIGADDLGLGAAAIGLALGAGGLGRLAGTLVGGRISDRVSRKAALVPALALQGGGVALLALPPSVGSWLGAIVVMSLASFAVPVAATILGDLSDPGRIGARFGRFRFTGDVGLVVGPLAITAIYDGLGRVVAFLLVAGLLLAVAVAARSLPDTGAGA